MSWVPMILLAAAIFAVLAFALKAPRGGWEAIGAALLLGLAGYVLQGHPDMPGAPKEAAEKISLDPASQVAERQKMSSNPADIGNSWQVIADGMIRNGQFANAATVLRGAIEKEPKNVDAWLALGNALVGHAEGNVSPAAIFAYQRAADAEPAHPGPPFFLGLALAQSGQLEQGRALWADLLKRTPPDAPWRKDLEQRLSQLDAMIAGQAAQGPVPPQ